MADLTEDVHDHNAHVRRAYAWLCNRGVHCAKARMSPAGAMRLHVATTLDVVDLIDHARACGIARPVGTKARVASMIRAAALRATR